MFGKVPAPSTFAKIYECVVLFFSEYTGIILLIALFLVLTKMIYESYNAVFSDMDVNVEDHINFFNEENRPDGSEESYTESRYGNDGSYEGSRHRIYHDESELSISSSDSQDYILTVPHRPHVLHPSGNDDNQLILQRNILEMEDRIRRFLEDTEMEDSDED